MTYTADNSRLKIRLKRWAHDIHQHQTISHRMKNLLMGFSLV